MFLISKLTCYTEPYVDLAYTSPTKGGTTIGGGGLMTPHLFQMLVFLLYSIVFAQCTDPPTFKL